MEIIACPGAVAAVAAAGVVAGDVSLRVGNAMTGWRVEAVYYCLYTTTLRGADIFLTFPSPHARERGREKIAYCIAFLYYTTHACVRARPAPPGLKCKREKEREQQLCSLSPLWRHTHTHARGK